MNTFFETMSSFEELYENSRGYDIMKQNMEMVKNNVGDKKYSSWKGDAKEFNEFTYVKEMKEELENSKKFKLDEELVNIFLNTDTEVDYIHTPFEGIFIDALIPVTEKTKIYGLYVFDPKIEGEETLGVMCLAKDDYGEGVRRHFTSFGFKYWKLEIIPEHVDIPCEIDKPLVKRKIALFVLSFLKFIYNPEVQIIEKRYTPIRIRRRYEEGKPVNNHYYLKITGKTREYISNFSNQLKEKYERRIDSWIVRGYYMKLKHPRYKNNIGKEIWIAPFVKGFGSTKEKEYIVTEKKKTFYNQILMESIIKDLFKNHLVLRNTRGFLDGLEMDCYIPDLKLGFEYNGEQHYKFISAFHKSEKDLLRQQKRDIDKNKLAKEKGIRLITIKYDEEINEDLIKSKIKDKYDN